MDATYHQFVAQYRAKRTKVSMMRYFEQLSEAQLTTCKELMQDGISEVNSELEHLSKFMEDLVVLNVMVGVVLGNIERNKSEEDLAVESKNNGPELQA